MEKKIHVIMTGGTIDSEFNPTKDTIEVLEETGIPNYIKKLQLYGSFEYTTLFLKDSRDIRYKDVEQILETVKNSPHDRIIITHGTYTMPDTAQYLKDHLPKSDKVVVLTGSMVPLKGFEFSDAPFNLGYVLAKIQSLSPGVYICMNGKVFDPDKVDKNRLEGRFEEI